MLPTAPRVFKLMCQNFGPDLGNVASSWDEMVLLALHNLEISDARSLKPFLDELLSGRYGNDELKELWWSMPATTVFHDGKDVYELLCRVRSAVARPPYTAP